MTTWQRPYIDFVIPRLPVDRSLDWKGSFIIAFKVIIVSNNIAQRTAGKISLIFGTSPYDFS